MRGQRPEPTRTRTGIRIGEGQALERGGADTGRQRGLFSRADSRPSIAV
jgi:hypothetical protein